MKSIQLNGVNQNNLKNINVSFPLGEITVICGPSGSGKSSLAFETLYAKGQREYINSLSSYARQFLDRSPQPDVDEVKNIPPAIAIEQSNHVTTSRSTVGTLTEIIDYLRLLFTNIGTPICLEHNIPIIADTVTSATDQVIRVFSGQRGYILVDITKDARKTEQNLLQFLLKSGHPRIFYKEEIIQLQPKTPLPEDHFEIIIDRTSFDPEDRGRIADSIAQAYSTFNHLYQCKKGKARAITTEGQEIKLSESPVCRKCGFALPPITHQFFNFSSPLGVCRKCEGAGRFLKFDKDKIIPNPDLTLSQNVVHPMNKAFLRYEKRDFLYVCANHYNINLNTPWNQIPEEKRSLIWTGKGRYPGLMEYLELCAKYRKDTKSANFLNSYKTSIVCDECKGSRLRKDAQAIRIKGKAITELCSYMLEDLLIFFKELSKENTEKIKVVSEPLQQIISRLRFLCDVGVNYLTLDRLTKTLSAGEYQRVHLAHQLGKALSQTLYVLDEPTVGLHPKDNDRLIKILNQLKDLGNTLVVVEHDKSMIQNSHHVVEMGPGSGQDGGKVIFSGHTKDFLQTSTLTSQVLREKNISYQKDKSSKQKLLLGPFLKITDCLGHNLKSIDVTFPLRQLVAVTGVSGSGKSSLLKGTLYPAILNKIKSSDDEQENLDVLPYKSLEVPSIIQNVLFVDQSPIGSTWRSYPATYLKIYDHIRKIMASTDEAKKRGYNAGFFSLMTEAGGRCPYCEGEGFETIDMAFADNVKLICEHCKGQRFQQEVFEVKYKGKHINEILNLTILEAMQFFKDIPAIYRPLAFLKEIGLEYLRLGQSTQDLSGGESQRLKLARQLIYAKNNNSLYILDEPTTGLHPKEVEMLVSIIRKLIKKGGSAIVIEHNIDLIKEADYVIELGPGGGKKGGELMFQGPTELLCQNTHCATAPYLKDYFM